MPVLDQSTMKPHQVDMVRLLGKSLRSGKLLFVHGGKGTHKTSTLVRGIYDSLAFLSTFYQDLRIVVAAMTHRQVQEAFVETWREQVPEDRWVWADDRTSIQLVGTYTKIWLRHSGDAKAGASAEGAARRRRGGNIHGYYFPQAESLSSVFYDEITSRCRGVPRRVPGKSIYPPFKLRVLDANPDSEDHWLKKRLLDEDSPVYIGDNALTMSVRTTPETSAYTRSEIEEFRKTWPEHEAARMLDGQWVGAAGSVYELYDGIHVTAEPIQHQPRWYLSGDYGFDPDPTVWLLIAVGGGHIHVVDECDMTRGLQDDHIAMIRQMLQRAHPEYGDSEGAQLQLSGVTGDPSGRYVREGGLSKGMVSVVRNEFDTNNVFTNTNRHQGWLLLRKLLTTTGDNDRPRLTLHPRCKRTLESIRSLTWDERKEDVADGDDHHADCVRYLVMSHAARIE